jgi:hypothetical protein
MATLSQRCAATISHAIGRYKQARCFVDSKVEAVIDVLPYRPVDVAQGCKAITHDASVVAGQLEDFVKGKSGVPDFRSQAVVLRYIAMTAEQCRLMLQADELVCRISLVARIRRVWPVIKNAVKYIAKGE